MCVRLPLDLVGSEREHRVSVPIDLTPGGPPHPYPKRRISPASWIVIWALFCSVGACTALLLWPKGTPAQGVRFWLCVVGAPNAVFLMVLGCARATYETAYLRALYRNQHRQNWLHERVALAQRPLYILAQTYFLPVDDGTLATTIIAGKTVMTTQPPRKATGHVLHSRLPDMEPIAEFAPGEEENPFGDSSEVATDCRVAIGRPKPDGFSQVVTNVLAPLADTLRTLSLLGGKYTPVVRLAVTDSSTASVRLQHVRDGLSKLGFPSIVCEAATAYEGLMLVDQWLDAGEVRPLLVIAAEWYDAVPPSGSTEGGVAVLFGVDALIGSVEAVGTLHRPVTANPDSQIGVPEGLSISALWGSTSAPEVCHAWVSGFNPDHDHRLAAAFKDASFKGLADSSGIRIPDRIVGHAGSAAAWLSVAAAVESEAEGPQLILDQSRTVQSAILYANPPPKHENQAETE
jgi:hypothetical protein